MVQPLWFYRMVPGESRALGAVVINGRTMYGPLEPFDASRRVFATLAGAESAARRRARAQGRTVYIQAGWKKFTLCGDEGRAFAIAAVHPGWTDPMIPAAPTRFGALGTVGVSTE